MPTNVPVIWRWARDALHTLEQSPHAVNRVLLVCWGATRLALFLGVVLGHRYCDPEFYHYAGQFAVGQWPYRDVPVEYPPVAMVALLLPAVPLLPFSGIAPRPIPGFSQTTIHQHPPSPDPTRFGAYGLSFALEMLLIDAATLWLVRRTARQIVPSDARGLWSGLLYVGMTFVSGGLLQKFDLVSGALCLAAVCALLSERRGIAWSTLALATLVKGFPVFAAPVFALYELRQSPYRSLLAAGRARFRPLVVGALWFAATMAAWILLVVVGAGWAAAITPLLYHAGRGAEIESLYATVMLDVRWLPGLAAHTAFNRRDLSRVVVSPLDQYASVAASVVLAALLLMLYAAAWRASVQQVRPEEARSLAGSLHWRTIWRYALRCGFTCQLAAPDAVSQDSRNATSSGQALVVGVVAALLGFMLAFRALPAHYLLGVLPLAAVIRLPWPRLNATWLTIVASVALLGQVITFIWGALVTLQPWAVAVLTVRNLAWVLAFGALVVALWRWPSPPATHVEARAEAPA